VTSISQTTSGVVERRETGGAVEGQRRTSGHRTRKLRCAGPPPRDLNRAFRPGHSSIDQRIRIHCLDVDRSYRKPMDRRTAR
jgi:hypothetical protein